MSDVIVKVVPCPDLDPNVAKIVSHVKYATPDSAGFDLLAASNGVVYPHRHSLVPTGVMLEIPSGYEGQVRPRSGLALKHNVTVLNSPGTIDADYRGEVRVILFNHSNETFTYSIGDRIAQLVISPVVKANIIVISPDKMSTTERGSGGFGSTGGIAL